MAENVSPFSLFSNSKGKKPVKKTSSGAKPEMIPDVPVEKKQEKPTEEVERPSNEALLAQMKNVKEKQMQLKAKIDEFYRLTGKTSVEIEQLIAEAEALNSPIWQAGKAAGEALLGTIGEETMRDIQKKQVKKETEKSIKSRKGKSVGARKKWLPIP